jgi:pimeloyl-ACP methyl ester carboxylesterase
MAASSFAPRPGYRSAIGETAAMPFAEREDGVRIWWEEHGAGPGVLFAPGYVQHPGVFQGLIDELERDHRVVRYDARGCGQSTRRGPYDMETDVADLAAVAEAAGSIDVALANGDAANRAIHAAARRPDLVPAVVSMETLPLTSGDAEGVEALVGSGGVLSALVAIMRTDYRAGLRAAIERGNPGMSQEALRERLDQTIAYIGHDAGLGRLDAWIHDRARDDALALGDRLILAYEGAGEWFPAGLHENARATLSEARFERLEGGAVSRPDLTAAVVRGVTGA